MHWSATLILIHDDETPLDECITVVCRFFSESIAHFRRQDNTGFFSRNESQELPPIIINPGQFVALEHTLDIPSIFHGCNLSGICWPRFESRVRKREFKNFDLKRFWATTPHDCTKIWERRYQRLFSAEWTEIAAIFSNLRSPSRAPEASAYL
ncbi:hypothetical protein EX30DRAFT_269404 [Ascodesmis nigricans]|uniref:Uncharacterized protein n=1 Tax=Ascodesmis nigricans TaxID=341454 RepID=A0A4S2MX27_9PEZI|nr:hypothetical protein EX30DRAFT_269404 [Ascodesmis nigricans]